MIGLKQNMFSVDETIFFIMMPDETAMVGYYHAILVSIVVLKYGNYC